MTCPDWNRLTAHRRIGGEAPAVAEPEGWPEALEHLDDCESCRDRALAADPLLLFRGLPSVAPDPTEIEDVQAGVAALRRAHRVAGATDGAAGARRRGSFRGWGRAAAAAILATGLLGLRPEAADVVRLTPQLQRAPVSVPIAHLGGATVSAVDDIDRPTASVYHFDDEEVGVVMVVDAGFDV